MNGLDLFSGIGGITKALDGYVVPVAYCEIEPYARGVLLSRMHTGDIPLAPIWDDVSTLRGAMLPQIDIIYGGFPCQDISVAGRGAGLGGERSGLFFQICRLAAETKSPFIFLENVPNIRTKGLGRVIKELDSLGYDCRWSLLSAADVGANHKRERWFFLAHTRGAGRESGDLCVQRNDGRPPREGQAAVAAKSGETPPSMADTKCDGLERDLQPGEQPTQLCGEPAGWWAVESNVGRVAYGLPKRVDRLRALGNAVVPAQVREAFERLMGLK